MTKEEPMKISSYIPNYTRGSNTVGHQSYMSEAELWPDTKENKAQSHSAGKPSLLDIHRWLDQDFLMECVEQMKHPVEVDKKYPKDNWKKGVGDEDFIKARLESAQRHLTRLALSDTMKEARDDETNRHEAACVMVNMMMVFHSLIGDK